MMVSQVRIRKYALRSPPEERTDLLTLLFGMHMVSCSWSWRPSGLADGTQEDAHRCG